MTMRIQLKGGKGTAIIDSSNVYPCSDQDFKNISNLNLIGLKAGNYVYPAFKTSRQGGKQKTITLQRLLMQPAKGERVVSLDGDRMNCRFENLKIVAKGGGVTPQKNKPKTKQKSRIKQNQKITQENHKKYEVTTMNVRSDKSTIAYVMLILASIISACLNYTSFEFILPTWKLPLLILLSVVLTGWSVMSNLDSFKIKRLLSFPFFFAALAFFLNISFNIYGVSLMITKAGSEAISSDMNVKRAEDMMSALNDKVRNYRGNDATETYSNLMDTYNKSLGLMQRSIDIADVENRVKNLFGLSGIHIWMAILVGVMVETSIIYFAHRATRIIGEDEDITVTDKIKVGKNGILA